MSIKLSDQHVPVAKMHPREYIKIRGAAEHNLKNLDVDIPRNGCPPVYQDQGSK